MRRRVLVTRPSAPADELSDRLREHGLEPVRVPTISLDLRSAEPGVDAMLHDLDGAAWLVITSVNGARALADRIEATGRAVPRSVRVAAVGPLTAEALIAAGITVDHVPDEYLTVAIADGLGEVAGRRVVLARAEPATPDLPHALRERGALVEEVVAYHVVEGPAAGRDALRAALRRGLDALAFTSGSTVRGLLRLAAPVDRGLVRAVPAFCIGPPTSETARRLGFHVAATAAPHTALGLADAIATQLTGGTS